MKSIALAAALALAVPARSFALMERYDLDSDVDLLADGFFPWFSTGGTQTFSSGVLTMSSSGYNEWIQHDTTSSWFVDVDNARGWIVEARVRIDPTSPSTTGDCGVGFWIMDLTYLFKVRIHPTTVMISHPVSRSYAMDTTDGFHTYTIQGMGTHLWVYVDSVLRIDEPAAGGGGGTAGLSFGDLGGGGTSLSHWDYFMYSTTLDSDMDGDGWTILAGDCDDSDPLVHPGVTTDPCDGIDNDCDSSTPDGSSETWYGTPCDGADVDLCEDGIEACPGGTRGCEDDDLLAPDVCDGIDNDCDPSTLDGSGDPLDGEPCDGDDTDLCAEGAWSCVSGSLECSDTMEETPETCDGIDNDCDASTPDGSDETWYGEPCDGTDPDLCEEGSSVCVSGVRACDDTTGGIDDLCDTLDNDCDPATADGSDEEWLDEPCDGTDTDLCAEGTYSCAGGVQTCSDVSADNAELCNGVDDDCNPATLESMDNDGDGISACGGDCDDGDPAVHPGAEEICDGADQDCDPTTDQDDDGDGYRDCEGDCAPSNAAVHPGAEEVCGDGLDNDCDGLPDFADPECVGTEGESGCGCSLAGGSASPPLAALLLLALVRRRR